MTNRPIFLRPLYLCIQIFLLLSSLSLWCEEETPNNWAPDFLIIGAHKAGTSTVMVNLLKHPNIAGRSQEPHFFSLHFEKGDRLWSPEEDLNWYKQQFPLRTEEKFILGEKSNSYLGCKKVPSRVFNLYPKVKLIVILRNPIDQCYSHYWMHVREGHQKNSFEYLVNIHINNPKNKRIQNQWSIFSSPFYARQLKYWLDIFPREQLLVVWFDDLETDLKRTMSSIFTFLEIPSEIEFKPVICNQHKQSYPPLESNLRQRLAEFYQPYNRELELLLDVELNWK